MSSWGPNFSHGTVHCNCKFHYYIFKKGKGNLYFKHHVHSVKTEQLDNILDNCFL